MYDKLNEDCGVFGIFNHKDAAELRNFHIGFIFQVFNLLPVYTVFENV